MESEVKNFNKLRRLYVLERGMAGGDFSVGESKCYTFCMFKESIPFPDAVKGWEDGLSTPTHGGH